MQTVLLRATSLFNACRFEPRYLIYMTAQTLNINTYAKRNRTVTMSSGSRLKAIVDGALPPGSSIWSIFLLTVSIVAALYSLHVVNKEAQLNRTDYADRARNILETTPLVDGHNDFPFLLRQQLHGQINSHDFEAGRLGSHTDFQKMREGMMGGQFWSVYVSCPEDLVPGVDLKDPNKRIPDLNEPSVRLTLFHEDRINIYNYHSGQYAIPSNKLTLPNA